MLEHVYALQRLRFAWAFDALFRSLFSLRRSGNLDADLLADSVHLFPGHHMRWRRTLALPATLRSRYCYYAAVPNVLRYHRPRTYFLVFAQVIERSLHLYVVSDRNRCADLVERGGARRQVTCTRLFEGPTEVFTL